MGLAEGYSRSCVSDESRKNKAHKDFHRRSRKRAVPGWSLGCTFHLSRSVQCSGKPVAPSRPKAARPGPELGPPPVRLTHTWRDRDTLTHCTESERPGQRVVICATCSSTGLTKRYRRPALSSATPYFFLNLDLGFNPFCPFTPSLACLRPWLLRLNLAWAGPESARRCRLQHSSLGLSTRPPALRPRLGIASSALVLQLQ
jgi:hypothetical protein